MSVLIVEDNAVNAKLLDHHLRKNGFATHLASNGAEALEMLRTKPDIRLVISDLMMPEMDGLQLLQEMKSRREWKTIPVIISTAMADIQTVKNAMRLGCRHYLVKPIKVPELLQKIRDIFDLEKPVLGVKRQLQTQYGLTSAAFDELAESFEKLLSAKVEAIEKGSAPGGEGLEFEILSDIAEVAPLMGAERFISVHSQLGEREAQRPLDEADWTLALRELKLLQRAMVSPSRSLGIWARVGGNA